MANPTNLPGDLVVPGNVRITGSISPLLARSSVLQQAELQSFPIPLTSCRVWDAMATLLPAAGANDDLGLVGGTWAAATPTLQTQNHGSGGAEANNYARFLVQLPWEYVQGSTVIIRFMAGMITAVADQSATTYIDLSVFKQQDDPDDAIGSDLCETSPILTVNSLTFANQDFTIAPSGLSAGDILDCRVKTAVDDNATGTVIMGISSIKLLCDVQ